jgi:heme exporter protein A
LNVALQSDDVRKTFGSFTALAGISMTVRRGEFVALFGRNGAGKTTFLKIAATLMRSTHGTLTIDGVRTDQHPETVRRRIGFLSHNTFLYRDLSPVENLRFFAKLYSISDAELRIPALIDRVGLKRRANDPVRTFSRGLQQRLGIARAILHEPALILLDEPYTGLDANAVQMLNEILDEAVSAGRTVILTTHDLDQGLRGATQAALIDRGKLVLMTKADDPAIRSAYAQYIREAAK